MKITASRYDEIAKQRDEYDAEIKKLKDKAQSCPTLSYSVDCSLPGSSIHGIFQARVLEWGAIAFSGFSKLVSTKPF